MRARRPWGGSRRSGGFGRSSPRRWHCRRIPAGWPAAASRRGPPKPPGSLAPTRRPSERPTGGPTPVLHWYGPPAPPGGWSPCRGFPRRPGAGPPGNGPAAGGSPHKPSARRGRWPVGPPRPGCHPEGRLTVPLPDRRRPFARRPATPGWYCSVLRWRRRPGSVLRCHQPSRPPVPLEYFRGSLWSGVTCSARGELVEPSSSRPSKGSG